MPRYVAYKNRTSKHNKDLKLASKYRVRGYKKTWIDPYPLGFGTLPEKILYKALSDRGIHFQYLNDISFSDPVVGFFKTFQADFILPDQKIIIEVNGYHWHSMASTIALDSFKYAVYEQFGWRVLPWWDFQIIDDINLLFINDPVLVNYPVLPFDIGSTEFLTVRTKTDTSKGIRTLNQKTKQRYSYRKKTVTVKSKRKVKNYGQSSVYNR